VSSHTLTRQHVAAGIGVAGGFLGVLAGLTQSAVGTRIPAWTGAKQSPVLLGVLTVVLSVAALTAALVLRAPHRVSADRRAAAAIGLLLPAGVCFSTVGRLWVVPGTLLLVAAGLTLAAGGTAQLWPVIAARWTRGLLSVLGASEILMAASAGPTVTIGVGFIGGGLLLVAPWLIAHRGAAALLLLGTVPFAVLTWWSLISPLVGLTAVVIGCVLLRTDRPGHRPTWTGANPGQAASNRRPT